MANPQQWQRKLNVSQCPKYIENKIAREFSGFKTSCVELIAQNISKIHPG